MLKYIINILVVINILFLSACNGSSSQSELNLQDWAPDVKQAVNDFVDEYGKNSINYSKNSYVVFDFDNTVSIFDVREQLFIYQFEVMSFLIKPEEMAQILAKGIPNLKRDVTSFGYGHGTYQDWISDIETAYYYLWNKYGPFDVKGLNQQEQQIIQQDPQWLEFVTKYRALYDLLYDAESADIAYVWLDSSFAGFTENEVYNLAIKAYNKYSFIKTEKITWTSPKEITSKIGSISITWTKGIQVSESLRELWKVLKNNGFDIWVASASHIDVIRAAIDFFGLHNFCHGVVAMTYKLDSNNQYTVDYDYDTGVAYYALKNGWKKGENASKTQVQGKGKVTAINNVIAPDYNNEPPLAGFMDSTGDFNFCTEYANMKLVIIFNRGNRKITDGGGLLAEIAIYQRDYLGYDFYTADRNSDTFYVLQGRNENGLRSLRANNKTLIYGVEEEKLFANSDNYAQLQYIIEHNLSTKDAINQFAIKTSKENSALGFKYGFLQEYNGYHSK